MLTVKHFLCCISLSNGAIIIALLGMMGVFGGISVCVIELFKGNGLKTVINHNIFLIIDLIIGFVANACLLIAIGKRKPYCVLVYLFPDAILIMLGFLIAIREIIQTITNSDYTGSYSLIFLSVTVTIICAYIWIVLYSFFIELKRERKHKQNASIDV